MKRDTAIHEAGHAVALEAFGVPVDNIHLEPDGRSGYVKPSEMLRRLLRSTQEGDPKRWEYLVAVVAGGVAECIAAGVDVADHREVYSDGDMDTIAWAAQGFGGGSNGGEADLDAAVSQAEREAGRLLRREWDRVQELAESL